MIRKRKEEASAEEKRRNGKKKRKGKKRGKREKRGKPFCLVIKSNNRTRKLGERLEKPVSGLASSSSSFSSSI